MSDKNTISLEELPELKAEYERAVKDGDTVFKFKGADILVDYAKYLIEHMENEKAKRGL